MARKYLILFAVLSLCLYNLISSFLGEKGYFANKELQRQLNINEYQIDKEEVELENLKQREKELSTEDGIRLAAINLGYQVESDEVYMFPEPDEVEIIHASVSDHDEKEKIFVPWKTGLILIVTFGSSILLTILVFLMKGPEVQDISDETVSQDSGYEDS